MITKKFAIQRLRDKHFLGGNTRNIHRVEKLDDARTFTEKVYAKSSYMYNRWKPGSAQIITLICELSDDRELLE